RTGQKFIPVEITALFVSEETPPVGEEPVEWMLLSSVRVETAEQMLRCRITIKVLLVNKALQRVKKPQFDPALSRPGACPLDLDLCIDNSKAWTLHLPNIFTTSSTGGNTTPL
ncbi:MAG: hypothetical protein H7835_20215, partial [Magnetococcus sp. XQGC-1]